MQPSGYVSVDVEEPRPYEVHPFPDTEGVYGVEIGTGNVTVYVHGSLDALHAFARDLDLSLATVQGAT